jgi:hypothetical protein
MFKLIPKVFKNKNNFIINNFSFKYFSTVSSTHTAEVFPNQIIEKLKSNKDLKNFDEESWTAMEANIVDTINFFDVDQYVDLVIMIAKADRGSQFLWDQLARRIYDYELDLIQTIELSDALGDCTKLDEVILDPLLNNTMVAQVKYENQLKALKNILS